MFPKWLFLVLFVIGSVTVAHAELPPTAYIKMQQNASEQLTIEVLEVSSSLCGLNEKTYTIIAKVTDISKTTSRLDKGDTITIEYNHVIKRPDGWVGPSPVPILEPKRRYKAYLHRDEKMLYRPSAGGKSFTF